MATFMTPRARARWRMRVAPVVLAAGQSTRMGAPKALLRKGVETSLGRIVRTARAAGAKPVVVVLGAHKWWVQHATAREITGARIVVNPRPEAGRTSSLKVALAAAGDPDVTLVWPVDHPDVTTDTIRALLAAAGPDRVAVPTYAGRRGHPVALGRAAAREAAALGDDAPLHDVVHRDPARVVEVRVTDAGVVADLDTPEDARRAGWLVPVDNDAVDNTCFVCSPANPIGLGLQWCREGDGVVADFELDDRYSGWPGRVLDGVRYGVLLDAIAWAGFAAEGTILATVRPATVRLGPALATHAPVRATGRVASRVQGVLRVRATLEQDGKEIDRAEGEERLPTDDDLKRWLAEAPASLHGGFEARLRAPRNG